LIGKFTIAGVSLLVALLAIFVDGCPASGQPANADWLYRGNSRRAGDFPIAAARDDDSSRSGLVKPLRWTFQTFPISVAPAVCASKVFLCELGTIYALDKNNGKEIWRFCHTIATKPAVLTAAPAVVQNKVIVGDENGTIIALDIGDGKQRWAYEAKAAVNGTPATCQDSLIFSSKDGFLYCLNATSGKLKWRSAIGSCESNVPVVDSGIVVCAGEGGVLYGINATSGQTIWQQRTNSTRVPVISSGSVAISSGSSVLAFDLKSGRRLWASSFKEKVSLEIAARGKQLFCTSGGSFYILNLLTGKTESARKFSQRLQSPSLAGNRAFFGNEDGTLYMVSVPDGRIIWRMKTGMESKISPIICGGTVYFVSNQLFVVDLKTMNWLASKSKSPYTMELQPDTPHPKTATAKTATAKN